MGAVDAEPGVFGATGRTARGSAASPFGVATISSGGQIGSAPSPGPGW
jgi:hypothetical protein